MKTVILFTIYLVCIAFSFSFLLSINANAISCIQYIPSTMTITIACGSTSLTDVYNSVNNANLLDKGSSRSWFLNANLEIKNGSTLFINSTDTNWLKINSTNGIPHYIKAEGNLVIDSVKITGWDTKTADYALTDRNGTIPRSYILISQGTGKTDITNSEIAYLGYNHARSFGLTYYTGVGSIIRNNNIYDMYYGFYSHSQNAHHITVENNKIHNNIVYGLDPHSGTHHLIMKNNEVYNNGKHGIICSTDCHNVLIETNKVFYNGQDGIMLYDHTSNSTIRNNTVFDNRDQIAVYHSSNGNKIYDNKINGGEVGIRINTNSTSNLIYNNSLFNSKYGIFLLQGASSNLIDSNTISNTSRVALYVKGPTTSNNVFKNNHLLNNQNDEIGRSNLGNSTVIFMNNTIDNTR